MVSTAFETAVLCMALNIGMEARGEPETGMYAVGKVTLNGAGGDYRKVCAEVFKPHRYSWTTRLRKGALSKGLTRPWFAQAERIAREVLTTPDWKYNPMYFHVCRGIGAVKPSWQKRKVFAGRIGNHCFYLETAVK